MPWTAASGRSYKLALLDTNILSEIVKRPRVEGHAFVRLFTSEPIVPCFSPYSLAELYDARQIYEGFVELFAEIPVFVTKPWEMIFGEELELYGSDRSPSPLLNAFTPNGPDASYDLRSLLAAVFEDPTTRKMIADGDRQEIAMDVLTSWQTNAKNFQATRAAPNAVDAARYAKEAGMQTLMSLAPDRALQMLETGDVPDVQECPSLLTMLYCQYWRLFDPNWTPVPGAVYDAKIMAVSPYMDLVLTERFQAEIFRKIRRHVSGLEELRVLTLGDLRQYLEHKAV